MGAPIPNYCGKCDTYYEFGSKAMKSGNCPKCKGQLMGRIPPEVWKDKPPDVQI